MPFSAGTLHPVLRAVNKETMRQVRRESHEQSLGSPSFPIRFVGQKNRRCLLDSPLCSCYEWAAKAMKDSSSSRLPLHPALIA